MLPVLLAPPTTASVGHILHFSDVHLNLSDSSSASEKEDVPYIRYFADAPLTLFESALRYAKEQVVADPELLLYTGDHAVHGSLTDRYIAKVVATNVCSEACEISPRDHATPTQVARPATIAATMTA